VGIAGTEGVRAAREGLNPIPHRISTRQGLQWRPFLLAMVYSAWCSGALL